MLKNKALIRQNIVKNTLWMDGGPPPVDGRGRRDELLRLYLLMHGRLLLGLLLRVLFGKVPADEATANGSNHLGIVLVVCLFTFSSRTTT